MARRALSLLLLLGVVPPSAHWRFCYGDQSASEAPNGVLFVDAAPTHYSGPALFGSSSAAESRKHVAIDGDAISSDLDFDFELELDSEAGAKSESPHEGDAASHQVQQFTEVELLDAAQGGDVELSKEPSLQDIAPKTFNFGRGVGYVATKSLKSQQPLFTLPMAQIMSLESAKRGRVGALLAANPDLPPAIALALHLLEERFLGSQSNFSSFVDSLPSTSDGLNSSMFYTREELELLQGSQLLRTIVTRAKALESFFDVLVEPVTSRAMDPPLFAKHEFTAAHFRWAMGVVWAHAFPIGDGSESDVMLAPVLSTIGVCVNDASGGGAKCPRSRIEVVQSTQQVVVYATRDYAPGDEILLFMGDKSSTMLMANHGFTRPMTSSSTPTNSKMMTMSTPDQVDLAIVLDADDPLVEVKGFLLSTQNMSMNDSYVLSYGAQQLPQTLLTSLRIKLLSGNEVARFKDLLGPVRDAKEPYAEPRHIAGLRNEFVAMRALVLACKNLLAQYPTSLEEDEETLASMRHDQMASREAQIRRMLVLEKRILHNAMGLARQQWTDLVLSDHPNLLRVD